MLANRNEVRDESRTADSGNVCNYAVRKLNIPSTISINKIILPVLPMVVKNGFLR
jgi:hypothetical protein